MTDEKLTFGYTEDGRGLAILSQGGHPQLGGGKCTILAVEECANMEEAQAWAKRQIATRPWESRQ